jgi:hypothetical protein
VAHDHQVSVGILVEVFGQVSQVLPAFRPQCRRIKAEQDARVEGDENAFSYPLHFRARNRLIQLARPAIHLVTDDRAGRTADGGSDDGALGSGAAGGSDGATDHGATRRTDHGAALGVLVAPGGYQ